MFNNEKGRFVALVHGSQDVEDLILIDNTRKLCCTSHDESCGTLLPSYKKEKDQRED